MAPLPVSRELTPSAPGAKQVVLHLRRSITAHCATATCRRQIEKSPLAQIVMSLSTVLDGEHWADDGDCDEPDGDRPDERVTRSGGWQDQDRRGIGVDRTWAASGVSAGEGVRPAWT